MEISPNDNNLVDELYDKLTWYTFQAGESNFDKDQVKAILNLLDKLDPLPEEDSQNTGYEINEHLESFPIEFSLDAREVRKRLGMDDPNKEYLPKIYLSSPISSETIFRKKKKKNYSTLVKIAVIALAVIGSGTYLSLNTNADRDKSFFEVLIDGQNSMKITVTGNEGDDHKTYYSSFDVLSDQHPNLLVPKYIPNNLELEELYTQAETSYSLYCASYDDNLSIKIYSVHNNLHSDFNNKFQESGWLLEDVADNLIILSRQKEHLVLWIDKGYIYTIQWDNLKEIKKIAESMKSND